MDNFWKLMGLYGFSCWDTIKIFKVILIDAYVQKCKVNKKGDTFYPPKWHC